MVMSSQPLVKLKPEHKDIEHMTRLNSKINLYLLQNTKVSDSEICVEGGVVVCPWGVGGVTSHL